MRSATENSSRIALADLMTMEQQRVLAEARAGAAARKAEEEKKQRAAVERLERERREREQAQQAERDKERAREQAALASELARARALQQVELEARQRALELQEQHEQALARIRPGNRTPGWMKEALLVLPMAGALGMFAVWSVEKGIRLDRETAMTALHRAQLNAREDDIALLHTRIGELEEQSLRYRNDLSALEQERDQLTVRLSALEEKKPSRPPAVRPTPTPADDLSGLLNDDPLSGLKKKRPEKKMEL